jgi:hypothetical protein
VAATSGESVLVAEAVGLLLEGFGLDDTLSGKDSLALVDDIASLATEASHADEAATVLEDLLRNARARADLRRQIATTCESRGLTSGAPQIDAATRIVTVDRTGRYVGGLKGLPDGAAEGSLHAFDAQHRKVKNACTGVQRQWRELESEIQPSLLTDVDLSKEAGRLRDDGWFFGLFGNESDAAKARVKKHLAPHVRGMSARKMAEVLDRTQEFLDDREFLREQLAEAPAWVAWAVDGDSGKLNAHRAASLRWMLSLSAGGEFGPIERELLSNSDWRLALSQQPIRLAAKALPEESNQEAGSPGVGRLAAWLAESGVTARADFAGFLDIVQEAVPQIALALAVVEKAHDCPQLRGKISAAVELSTGPFGSGDPNRAPFRLLMDKSRGDVEQLRSRLDPLRPQHPHLDAIIGELRESEGQMIADLRAQTPVRGPLRVAIAGRTKAGKTTLRKVLTRDLTEEGIGRGAHRTTRTADDFAWDRITFVDTPGVSAKDDEYDAELAAQTCRDADAVVWVYAESIHEEEAAILQSLLTVKPILIVYNAKLRVDDPRRLAMFGRQPGLAFHDEASHAERSRQMADAAQVRDPLFIAAHVSAARRALIAGSEAEAAWHASRIPLLESELRRILSSKAQGLRSMRLADQVRTPIVLAAGRADATTEALAVRTDTFRHRLGNEERDIHQAAGRALGKAEARANRQFALAQGQLPAWVKRMESKNRDTIANEWARFLGKLQVDQILEGISASIRADAKSSGLLLDREDRLEHKLQRRRFLTAARVRRSPFAVAWRFIKKFVGLVVRNAPRFGEEAALGPPGWALLIADVVTTLGRTATDEIRESSIDQHKWEQNAAQAARDELERVRTRVTQELEIVRYGVTANATAHFAQARGELTAIDVNLAGLARFNADAESAVARIDKLTVERLLSLGRVDSSVVAVTRVPNLSLHVTVISEQAAVQRCLDSVFDGCLSETVTVSKASRKARRARSQRTR